MFEEIPKCISSVSVKLEKIDEQCTQNIERIKTYQKSKTNKHNGSVFETVNTTTKANHNNDQKDNFKDVNLAHSIKVKQEKVSTEHINTGIKSVSSKQKNNLKNAIQIKQEKLCETGLQDKTVQKDGNIFNVNLSETALPSSPNFPLNPSNKQPCNFLPFSGAEFLHSQIQTNPALQSILKDVITLNSQYLDIDDNYLLDEVEQLRTKNDLPSLSTVISPFNDEDSDCAEDSCQGSDDEIDKDIEFNNGNNERFEGIARTKTKPIFEDSDRLLVDEPDDESDDEPEYDNVKTKKPISITRTKSTPILGDSDRPIVDEPDDESDDEPEYVNVRTRKPTEVVFVNGSLVEIDHEIPECPICAIMFKSVHTLKNHIKLCSGEKCNIPENKSQDNFEGNFTICQDHLTREERGLKRSFEYEKDDGLNRLKIGQIFSAGQEAVQNGASKHKKGSKRNVSTRQTTSVEECLQKKLPNNINDNPSKQKINRNNPARFKRKCTDCHITFFCNDSLDVHFKKTGHEEVYPRRTCGFCNFYSYDPLEYKRHITEKHSKCDDTSSSAEIIEIDDD